jgi:hypothetical protein
MGPETNCKKCDKQLTHIVRVELNPATAVWPDQIRIFSVI